MAERLEKPSGGLTQRAHPEKTYKTSDARPHYVEVDALRGVAILGVVMTHAVGTWYNKVQQPLIIPLLNIDLLDLFAKSLGPFCLGVFILVSGYFLSWAEERRASRGDYSLRAYALRRILRIVPAYYVAIVVVFLLWPTTPTLTDTLLHLAFLQTFWPSYHNSAYDPAWWYLTSEVLFYALLPLLVLKIRGLYPRLALFGALVALYVTINVYWNPDNMTLPFSTYPLRHVWLFVAGVLLRMLVDRFRERSRGGYWPVATFLLFVATMAIVVLWPHILPHVSFLGTLMEPRLLVTPLAIPFFVAALLGSPVLSRVLSWRLLAFVGIISYSLYLLHETVLMIVRVYLWRWARPLFNELWQLDGAAVWLAFAGYSGVILIMCGAVAYLSYRYIESPFLRIRPK